MASTAGSSTLATTVVASDRPGDEVGPAIGQHLELAVAVELVTEEVHEDHHPGPGLVHHRVERGLVHLEHPDLGAGVVLGRGEQGAGHAPQQVGPRGVGDHPPTRGLDGRHQQPGRRRLAVGGRHRRSSRRSGRRPAPRRRGAAVGAAPGPAGSCHRPARLVGTPLRWSGRWSGPAVAPRQATAAPPRTDRTRHTSARDPTTPVSRPGARGQTLRKRWARRSPRRTRRRCRTT